MRYLCVCVDVCACLRAYLGRVDKWCYISSKWQLVWNVILLMWYLCVRACACMHACTELLGGSPSEEYGTVRLWLEYSAGAVLGFLVSRYPGACLKDATYYILSCSTSCRFVKLCVQGLFWISTSYCKAFPYLDREKFWLWFIRMISEQYHWTLRSRLFL